MILVVKRLDIRNFRSIAASPISFLFKSVQDERGNTNVYLRKIALYALYSITTMSQYFSLGSSHCRTPSRCENAKDWGEPLL
ncbi:hypothetical protein D3C75_712940 [compost metagenome]